MKANVAVGERLTASPFAGLRMARQDQSSAVGYALAALLVTLALAVTLVIEPLREHAVTLLFSGAVTITAWYGGLWPGLVATALSMAAMEVFILRGFVDAGTEWADALTLTTFGTVALMITSLNALRKRAETEFRRQEARLAEMVEERTAQLTHALTTVRDAEERFRLLFEEAPVPYHEVDRDGMVRRVNRAECELLGRTREGILGRPVWEFVAPEQQEASRRDVLSKLEGRMDVVPFTREYVSANGRRLSVHIHENLIRNRDGEIVGIRSTLLDVTERVRADEHIRKLNADLETRVEERTAELQRSNDALQQFAYSVSHDLQEPLRMVSSYTQLLARRFPETLDSDAREFMEHVVDGASRMSHLIKDLLTFSRAGAAAGAELERVAMTQVVERATRNLELAVEESGAVVTYGELPVVCAHPVTLVQVLQNLIGNAIKYRSSATPAIHISVSEKPGEWVFCVADNGIGFSQAYADRIFGVFKRLHGRQYPGTGIGLAICKRIVEGSGGRIWAESEPGIGSRFYFTLPKREETTDRLPA